MLDMDLNLKLQFWLFYIFKESVCASQRLCNNGTCVFNQKSTGGYYCRCDENSYGKNCEKRE